MLSWFLEGKGGKMDEKLKSAVNVAAKAAGMDAEDFIEAVFRYRKKEYELEDIIAWMQDHDISPDTSDIRPEEILEEYYHHGDCNVDYWSNIRNAYTRICGFR